MPQLAVGQKYRVPKENLLVKDKIDLSTSTCSFTYIRDFLFDP